MPYSPVPTLLAMLICDQVITDAETKKKTLVGVFDRYLTTGVPLRANLAVYAKLVDAVGSYLFMLRMVNLKNENPVIDLKTNLFEWKEPRQAMELALNFRGIPIPEFGAYEFQLYANEVYVGRATIDVQRLALPQQGPGGSGPGARRS